MYHCQMTPTHRVYRSTNSNAVLRSTLTNPAQEQIGANQNKNIFHHSAVVTPMQESKVFCPSLTLLLLVSEVSTRIMGARIAEQMLSLGGPLDALQDNKESG